MQFFNPQRENVPRELLKWFQSLDLSYPVKIPKRDFANGYLIAEIFNRYYPQLLSLHGFENGLSVKNKTSNWIQIMRLMEKVGMQYDKKQIDGIMYSNDGFVIPFVCSCYEFLTNKKISLAKASPTDLPPVDYKKATASSIIKENMHASDIQTNPDPHFTQSRMKNTLEKHEDLLQEDKIINPSRYNPERTNKTTYQQVGLKEIPTKMTIERVEVKKVDNTISQIRATKEMNNTSSAARLPSTMMTVQDHMLKDDGPYIPVAKIFDDIIKETPSFGSLSTKSFVYLTDLLLKNGPTSDIVENIHLVLNSVLPNMPAVIKACTSQPKEFWNLTELIYPILKSNINVHSPLMDSVSTFYNYFASNMINRGEQRLLSSLFIDYMVPRISDILKFSSDRAEFLMKILTLFTPPASEERVIVFKSLKDKLDDIGLFTLCVSILIEDESSLSPELLDIYLYFASMGIKHSSPTIRAAGICIVASLAERRIPEVSATLESVYSLTTDNWWEVQAMLVKLSCNLLLYFPDEKKEDFLKFILRNLSESCTYSILMVTLCCCSTLLSDYNDLLYPFVHCLFYLPFDLRKQILVKTSGIQCPTPTPLSFNLLGLPLTWNPTLLIETVVSYIIHNKLDSLDEHQFFVILTLIQTHIVSPNLANTQSNWSECLEKITNYLCVGLCDSDCYPIVSDIFYLIASYLSYGQILLKCDLLKRALVLIYPTETKCDVNCQRNLNKLFQNIFSLSNDSSKSLIIMIKEFAQEYPENMNIATELHSFLSHE